MEQTIPQRKKQNKKTTLREKLGNEIFTVGFENLRYVPGCLEKHKHTQGGIHSEEYIHA